MRIILVAVAVMVAVVGVVLAPKLMTDPAEPPPLIPVPKVVTVEPPRRETPEEIKSRRELEAKERKKFSKEDSKNSNCTQFASEVIPFFRARSASKEDMREVASAFCRANYGDTNKKLHEGFWGQYR